MVRTRGGLVQNPARASPAAHGRKGRREHSSRKTSGTGTDPPGSVTRGRKERTAVHKFIDKATEDRYNSFVQNKREIIVQPSCRDEDLHKFNLQWVLDRFEFQNWQRILHVNNDVWPDMVFQFYANLRQNEEQDLVTRINCRDLVMSINFINSCFYCEVDDSGVDTFFGYDNWPSESNGFDLDDLRENYFHVDFDKPGDAP